jgi:hypothetical protein
MIKIKGLFVIDPTVKSKKIIGSLKRVDKIQDKQRYDSDSRTRSAVNRSNRASLPRLRQEIEPMVHLADIPVEVRLDNLLPFARVRDVLRLGSTSPHSGTLR